MALNDVRTEYAATDWTIVGHPQQQQRPPKLVAAFIVGIVALVLGAALGVGVTQSRCTSSGEKIEELRTLTSQGKTDVVVGLADLYLSNRNACRDTQAALATFAYQAAMQEIYKHPELGGQATVLRWREADARAASFGVPADQRSPMTIFETGYNARHWQLARAAFLKAWSDGLVGPQDLQQVGKYGAALYNWGKQLLTNRTQDTERTALALIATACAIDRGYALYQGVACRELVERLGSDEQAWPTPLGDDPVLAAARQ